MKLTKKQLKQLEKIFKQHHAELAYLFGSQVNGQTTPLSDIDIAVYFDPKIPSSRYFDLNADIVLALGKFFQTKYLDVVTLNTASPLLAHQAVIEGKLLYAKDEFRHLSLYVQTLHSYEDTRHIREIVYAEMKHRLKTGTFGKPPRVQ